MKNQEIEVIVNTPDEEILQEMMAKAIASIVMGKINNMYTTKIESLYERIFEKLKNECK
ncbi:hypothetical protein [Caloranaerobacter sp. DY30410]|uniref:hypothetical protein n=1 Tax=Caloranaerobacter sp. DY30410 TaxID=3238305 RepID=UPI003D062180